MKSMTGYGRSMLSHDGRSLSVEIRSVNHRFLDISLRMPRSLGFLEDGMRKHIAQKIARGHLDVSVSYQNLRPDAREVRADLSLAERYKEALMQLNRVLGLNEQSGFEQIASFPDVLSASEAEEDEEALQGLMDEALSQALDRLIEMRQSEGKRMEEALLVILDEIEQKSFLIDERYPETVKEYSGRLSERLKELTGGGVDPARIAQEVALMADKAAVDEETVRLRSHIKHARELCGQSAPAGRSLDFLVQEMNREVNTVSSKSQDLPITQACIECKSAIEKLREQLQNIE